MFHACKEAWIDLAFGEMRAQRRMKRGKAIWRQESCEIDL